MEDTHLRNHTFRSLVHLSPRNPMEAIISNFSGRIFVASGNLYCCHEMNGHREKYVLFKPLLKTEKHNVIVEQNKINFGGRGPRKCSHAPLIWSSLHPQTNEQTPQQPHKQTNKQTNKHPNKQTNKRCCPGRRFSFLHFFLNNWKFEIWIQCKVDGILMVFYENKSDWVCNFDSDSDLYDVWMNWHCDGSGELGWTCNTRPFFHFTV